MQINDDQWQRGFAALLDQISREIASNQRPTIALRDTYWSARQVGEYLDVSPRHVTERLSSLPDFPKAKRMPSEKGRGHLRWRASEIVAWMGRQSA